MKLWKGKMWVCLSWSRWCWHEFGQFFIWYYFVSYALSKLLLCISSSSSFCLCSANSYRLHLFTFLMLPSLFHYFQTFSKTQSLELQKIISIFNFMSLVILVISDLFRPFGDDFLAWLPLKTICKKKKKFNFLIKNRKVIYF